MFKRTLGIQIAKELVHNNNNNNNNNNNRIQRRNSRLFFTISSLCLETSPTLTLKWPGRNRVQIMCNILSAYHMQHVMLHVVWYKGTAQLLNLSLNPIYLSFILLAEPLTNERGEETGVPRKKKPWQRVQSHLAKSLKPLIYQCFPTHGQSLVVV